MYKENDEERQKQQYLRENILNKGFDANEFMDYFKSRNGGQDINLNDWGMNELIEIVNGFYSKKGQYNLQNKDNNSFPTIPNDLRSENDIENYDNQNNILNEDQNESIMEEYAKCIKIEKTDISKIEDLEIKVGYPEKIEPGLFSKSYISYVISTIPLGLNIRKRYSEFEWLYLQLNKHYLNCIVPPLCKKNYMDQFNEDFISKRARALERFMNGIAIHPILKNSFIFYDFLTIKDENEFKQKKYMYEKPFDPKRIKDLNSIDGQIKVSLTNENEIYYQNILDNVDSNEVFISQIIKNYKILFELIKKVNEQMNEIGYLWKKLEGKSKQFYESSNTYTSYKIMKEIMKDWVEMNKRQIIEINLNIIESFRYIKNEYSSFKIFSERINDKKNIFFKKFDKFYYEEMGNLDKKKKLSIPEKIERFNDIDFSKISPMNIQELREAKNFYCGYLNSFISEYERLRILNGQRIKENVTKLINLLCKECQDFSEIIKGKEIYYENVEEISYNFRKNSTFNLSN